MKRTMTKYRYKLLALILVGASAEMLSSCSDDPLAGSGSYTSTVKIISQDVCFDAPAAEGTIQFSAPGAASVSATSEWCKTSLSGSVVKVSATQNNTRNSRSCNVIIKSGADSAVVSVVQNGYIFKISDCKALTTDTDNEKTLSYDYSENLDFTLSPSDDWFTATKDKDSIRITLKENTSGHIRKGYLHFTAGGAHDSIAVIQYEYAKDVAGTAYLSFKDANGGEHTTSIVLEDSCFTMPEFARYGNWKIPFSFSAEKMMFSFTNAQDVGMYNNTYYVSDIIYGSGYYSTYKSISWDAYIKYDENSKCMTAAMVDNGSWQYPFEAFYLRAFTSTTYNSTTDKGAIAIFYSPVIIRYDNNE